jgi:site-specific recombinase XerD
VLTADLRPHPDADAFLQHVRWGRDGAESTTQAYAGSLALFLTWCAESDLDWRQAGGRLGWFITWLQAVPAEHAGRRPRPRGPRRINAVLAAVREFAKFSVAVGAAPPEVLSALYEHGDDRWLPTELRLESGRLRARSHPRHRLHVADAEPSNVNAEQVLALVRACTSARDRFIVLALARLGLRRGELLGLRRGDVHASVDSAALGCLVAREHVHVRRRDDNPNRAWAKSRHSRVVPMDQLMVQAYDQYLLERSGCPPAAFSDVLLVNVSREPLGVAMRVGAVNELLATLSRRAGLPARVHPHLLRHTFATNLLEAGATVDEAQLLLGHATLTSTQVYLHPSPDRLRAAVDRAEQAGPTHA